MNTGLYGCIIFIFIATTTTPTLMNPSESDPQLMHTAEVDPGPPTTYTYDNIDEHL